MSNIKILIICILFLFAFIIGFKNLNKPQPLKNTINKVIPKPSITFIKNTVESLLKDKVEQTLFGIEGTYAVAIKNLKTGESFYLNEHQVFQSASLYKNWIMAVTYNQISKGLFTEKDLLSQAVSILNNKFNIQDEDAECTEGVITMKVKDALE